MENPIPSASPPLVLFGAFDRHNFGDLLFPHLMTALLPEQSFAFAGLVARDLQAFGGHRVVALGAWGDRRPVRLIHVGGELLTCNAWQAAVMLLDPDAAAEAIARYDNDPRAAMRWAARRLGTSRAMPYVVGREVLAEPGRLIFNAMGGVEWRDVPAAHRQAVKSALRQADWVSVRDHLTQAALRAEGLDFPLCPDPAVMVAECLGERIATRRQQGEMKEVLEAFPQGYLACQFSAEFGDDATLDALAQGLSRVAAGTGLGLVLYRAGAAPWHDDAGLYEALQQRLPPGTARRFPSLNVWDVCALIAASRGTVGSSLHGRIVALAHGLPRVSLIPPQQGTRPVKTAAFAETWEPKAIPPSVTVDQVEPAVVQALAVPAHVLRENAASLRTRYLDSQAQWTGLLTP